jgi:hypothetical protein
METTSITHMQAIKLVVSNTLHTENQHTVIIGHPKFKHLSNDIRTQYNGIRITNGDKFGPYEVWPDAGFVGHLGARVVTYPYLADIIPLKKHSLIPTPTVLFYNYDKQPDKRKLWFHAVLDELLGHRQMGNLYRVT